MEMSVWCSYWTIWSWATLIDSICSSSVSVTCVCASDMWRTVIFFMLRGFFLFVTVLGGSENSWSRLVLSLRFLCWFCIWNLQLIPYVELSSLEVCNLFCMWNFHIGIWAFFHMWNFHIWKWAFFHMWNFHIWKWAFFHMWNFHIWKWAFFHMWNFPLWKLCDLFYLYVFVN